MTKSAKIMVSIFAVLVVFALGTMYQVQIQQDPVSAQSPDGNSLDAVDGSPVDVVFVDSEGKVGIGTTTPVYKLDVSGNVGLGNGAGIAFRHGGSQFADITPDGGTLEFTSNPNKVNAFNFQNSGGGTVMSVDTLNRRIGIGTIAPQGLLHVRPGLNENLVVRSANGLLLESVNDANDDNQGLKLQGKWLSLKTGSTDRLYIDNAGKVGIGTTNPTQKLSVNGSVLSKETVVSTAASRWPDFVFEDGYVLMSLEQLEKFIEANGHLPGMPTAEEVAEDGIALGEMNARLLEKFEEQTLYTIQQEKRISQLETGNVSQAIGQSSSRDYLMMGAGIAIGATVMLLAISFVLLRRVSLRLGVHTQS